jgi:phosphoglycolate phosphatase-like HAD superfamily hydrolase
MHNWNSKFKGIIFDLDGTLVDSALDLYAFLKKVKMINGIPALLAYKKSLYTPETFFVPFKNATGADKALVAQFYKESLGN